MIMEEKVEDENNEKREVMKAIEREKNKGVRRKK